MLFASLSDLSITALVLGIFGLLGASCLLYVSL